MNNATRSPWARRILPAVLTVLALVLLLYVVWRIDRAPRTDDAYAYADTINVTPQVNGNIVELAVHENQQVKAGDVLFRIDPRAYENVLSQQHASLNALNQQIVLTQRSVDAQRLEAAASQASIERARAMAKQAGDTLRRTQPLMPKGFVSAESLDQLSTAERSARSDLAVSQIRARQATAAISGVDALVAQRAMIAAQIASAELNLEYTTVRAPFDGRVVGLTTANGQFAAAGHALFSLIDTRHWYIVANFRETELDSIHPGNKSTVYLMSDTRQQFSGTVTSIGFGVFPDDGGGQVGGLPKVARSINWVRVAQRFPVRILVDTPSPDLFRIGASAVVVITGDASPTEQK